MPISRTYRPQQFSDVTGQQHVTETLRKEVEQGMLGHAYLFSGPRGVGKTTSARIFAKALLCEHPKNGEPDGTCAACVEVTSGSCIDLIEMDAASHTGVENVREAIIEHVRFAPARWKRKVYVIDEAHMLSTSAWNALLKTLEEPPPYAIFILATTELHKVPATILSRCQRFEFKRIAAADMAERMRFIASEEGLKIDEDVVASLVRVADGYLRDAESLLEQLRSLGEKKITKEIAELILPVSSLPAAANLLQVCSTKDVSAALQTLRKLLEEGTGALSLFDDLLHVVRMLIRAQDPSEAKILSSGDEAGRAIHALHGRFTVGELGDIALVLIERRRDAKGGVDAAFALELAIVAIASGLLPHSGGTNGTARAEPIRTPAPAPAPAPVPAPVTPTSKPKAPEEPIHKSEPMVAPPVQTAPAIVQTAQPVIEIHDIRIQWREIIRIVEQENRSLPFVLKISQPESVIGNVVTIRFQYPFHYEKIIDDLKTKRIVESALRKITKRDDILIEGVVGELVGAADRPATTDIVTKVLNAFGGTVVE